MVLSLRPNTAAQSTLTWQPTQVAEVCKHDIAVPAGGSGQQNPPVVGEDLQPGRVNYFIGNNPAKWHTNVPTYARVRYKNVYPGN